MLLISFKDLGIEFLGDQCYTMNLREENQARMKRVCFMVSIETNVKDRK